MPNNIISFDTGVVEYKINDAYTLAFNPTDVFFIERIFATFDALDQKQDAYSAAIEKVKTNAEVFETAHTMDAEMREMIDTAFGAEVSAPIFGGLNVYALADGLPLWVNLMMGIIDEMDSAFAREKKAGNARMQKWTEKYNKKRKN